MNILKNLTVTAISASMILASGNQSVLASKIYPNLEKIGNNHDLAMSSTQLIEQSSLISSSNKAVEIQDSAISAGIPQPITLGFFLVMAGLGGFFKLKIAHAKINQHSTFISD